MGKVQRISCSRKIIEVDNKFYEENEYILQGTCKSESSGIELSYVFVTLVGDINFF